MHALRVRGAVPALVCGTLFAFALLPGHAHPTNPVTQDPTRGEPVPCASSDAAMPRGLAAVLPPGATDPARNLEALKNPFMSGVAMQLNWRDLEPVQDKPDWSRL